MKSTDNNTDCAIALEKDMNSPHIIVLFVVVKQRIITEHLIFRYQAVSCQNEKLLDNIAVIVDQSSG